MTDLRRDLVQRKRVLLSRIEEIGTQPASGLSVFQVEAMLRKLAELRTELVKIDAQLSEIPTARQVSLYA